MADEAQERRGRLLLLGKGAVLAHRLARPLAAETDELEQSPAREERERAAAPFMDAGVRPPTQPALAWDELGASTARSGGFPLRPGDSLGCLHL
jgi:hypothetical protein